MLLRAVALVLLLAQSASGVALGNVLPDEEKPLEPHNARFTQMISQARTQLMDSAAAIATVEGAEVAPAPAGAGAAASLAASKALPAALGELSDAVGKLRNVHAEVAQSTSLDAEVKAQVLWNIDKMINDSQRLRDASMAPYAREAVVRALKLRFGVLLNPSFWREAVDRKLLDSA